MFLAIVFFPAEFTVSHVPIAAGLCDRPRFDWARRIRAAAMRSGRSVSCGRAGCLAAGEGRHVRTVLRRSGSVGGIRPIQSPDERSDMWLYAASRMSLRPCGLL